MKGDGPSIAGAEILDALEKLVDPFVIIDTSGYVVHANPAACDLFGWERDELEGEKVNVLMGEPFRTQHDGYLQNYLATGERKAIGQVRRVVGRHRDGHDFPCELSVSVSKGADGETRFYGIVRDASERERVQAKLAQTERLTAMGELAAGIAHEVNNPVNTIINCAQLVKDGDDDPRLLDDVIQEGMRIATTVRDLLNFARDHHDELVEVDVGASLNRALRLVSRRIERQGVTLAVDLAPNLPTVRARAHQIQQVLINLLLNARDALVEAEDLEADGKRVQIRGYGDESDFVLEVWDNGPGIPAEILDSIFEPFYTRRRNSDGTGMGLAVTRGIIDEHGGTIAVHSEPGVETVFTVRLPRADQ